MQNDFYCSLRSYSTNKHDLKNSPSHFSKPNSNYHLPLNVCTTKFIIILNFKNSLIFIITTCMFYIFPLQLLDKLDWEVLEFDYIYHWLFWTNIQLGI